MSLMISELAGIASMLAIRGLFEAEGDEQPMLSIWSGEMPSPIETDVHADDNKLLVEFPLIGTVFGDPVREGDTLVAELLPIGGVIGSDDGEASFFRMYDRNGVTVMQGSVGLEGSDAVLAIDDIEITTQKLSTVQSLRLILPLVGA